MNLRELIKATALSNTRRRMRQTVLNAAAAASPAESLVERIFRGMAVIPLTPGEPEQAADDKPTTPLN